MKSITIFFIALLLTPLASIEASGLSVSAQQNQTGQPIEFSALCNQGKEFVYYVFDWGDGSISATARGDYNYQATLEHRFDQAGLYDVSWKAITMSGRLYDGKTTPVNIAGSKTERPVISAVQILASPSADDKLQTASQDNPFHTAWIGQTYDRLYRFDEIILTPAAGAEFPEYFAVEYSMDEGNTWQDIPSANYVHFPNPQGKRVRVPLHGVTANGLRMISHRPPRTSQGYKLSLGGFDAIGNTRLLFRCDADYQFNAAINNMWLVYGSAENEVHHAFNPWWPTDRPDSGGMMGIGSTAWSDWNAFKICWINTKHRAYYEDMLNNYPVDEQGRIGVAVGQYHHLGHSRHYANQPIFVSAVANYVLSSRDPTLLLRKDPHNGLSLLEKLGKVMQYQLKEMEGEKGLLVIKDPDNDGTINGKSDNYWDAWRFGCKSSYENILFYDALQKMSMLEKFIGRDNNADQYRKLAATVSEQFNSTFWNDKNGRYIGAIDRLGNQHDYGFTFVNLEAIAHGLVPPERASRIMAWLDGREIIEGDTSTGADIYHFIIGPRSNTLAAEAVQPSWWDDWAMEIGKDKGGEYGTQIQNGGMILYVSYYDLMARLKAAGIGDAMKRFNVILEEFSKDQLRRQPGNRFGYTAVLGIVREFPESGLLPLFYLHGILGIRSEARGLVIEPHLPENWSFAEVTEYRYAGQTYHIRVDRNAEKTKIVEIRDSRIGLLIPANSPRILIQTKHGKRTLARYQP